VAGRSGSCMTLADGGGVCAPNNDAATQGLLLMLKPDKAGEPATFVGVLPDGVSVTVAKTDGSEAQVTSSDNAFWVTGSSLSSLTVHTAGGAQTVLTVGPPPPPPSAQ
jgi:hypothetical protein